MTTNTDDALVINRASEVREKFDRYLRRSKYLGLSDAVRNLIVDDLLGFLGVGQPEQQVRERDVKAVTACAEGFAVRLDEWEQAVELRDSIARIERVLEGRKP